jgi:septum formation protein
MTGRQLILASASPRRRELLAELVETFAVVTAGIEEDERGAVEELAGRLALAKARAVASQNSAGVVLGADTVVALSGMPFGKPGDGDAARGMLRTLRGHTHQVFTAVAVVANGDVVQAMSVSNVTLSDLSDTDIEAYIASGRPLDKAGAYAIQDDDVPTVAGLDGCYCGVMGLPLWLTRRLLSRCGIDARPPRLPRCQDCPDRDSWQPPGYGVVADATSE